MKVPLSWLRDYVDVDLTPEALAERLTLLGMEVKGIVRWGEDWRNVVVGELLSVERHPRADRLSLTRVTVGDGEPLDIVCGATNIAAGQRVPVALPGAVLPGDRRIERTEKMGVVSNGMLCSGDELGLTADADGILILPADAAIGRPLADLYGDIVLDVDVKPNRGDALSIIGLAREIAAVTGASLRTPPTDPPETGRPDDRAPERRGARPGPLSAVRRPLGEWRPGRPVAGLGPDATPGRRPAADQQRRRCLELRHARIRQADPHLRCRRGPRRPDHRPPRGPGRALRDPRPRRARARPGDAAHRRRDGSARDRRDHGRRRVRDRGGDHRRRRRVGHLRTDQHPPDGLPLRPPIRGQPALREGPGIPPRPDRCRPDGPASSPSGRAARSPRARSIRTPNEPPPAHVAFRPARVNRLLGTDFSTDEQRALLARVGIETAPAAPGHPGPHRRRARTRWTSSPAMPRWSMRRSRAGGATWRSRPTSPRRSSASAATTSSRPPCRTRRCRPTATIRSSCATPSARRSPAPACPRS